MFLILMFITSIKFTHDDLLSHEDIDRLDNDVYQLVISSPSELPDDVYWMLPKIY